MNTPLDPLAFKARTREQWDRSADGWNDHAAAVDAWLKPATQAMLEAVGIATGSRVLDVACGAGDPALDIARRVGPTGSVLATDLSPALVSHAQARAERAGLSHLRTRVADAEELDVPPGSFDAAVCRLGLMLMPQPGRAVQAMVRALRGGGRIGALVFGPPAHNPCVTTLLASAVRHAGLPLPKPDAPGALFSLADAARLEAILEDAGCVDIDVKPVDAPWRMPSAQSYLAFVKDAAGPVRQLLAMLDEPSRRAALDEMAQRLAEHQTDAGWVGPNRLLLATARRPA